MNKAQFKKRLRALFNIASDIFDKIYSNRPPFGIRKMVYSSQGEGSMSAGEQTAINYDISLSYFFERLKIIKEYIDFKELLLRDNNIAKSVNCMIGYHGGLWRFTDDDLIKEIIRSLFEQISEGGKPDIELTYNQLLMFYGSTNSTNSGVVFLDNVNFSKSPIKIDEDIYIENLSREESIKMLNTDEIFEKYYGFSSGRPLIFARSLVRFSFTEQRILVPLEEEDNYQYHALENPDIVGRILKLMDSIRVFADRIISTSPIILYHKYSPFYEWTSTIPIPKSPSKFMPLQASTLTNVNELKTFYSNLTKNEYSTAQHIAFNRLEKFGARETNEDKILDLFIGFESLILGEICKIPDIQGELTFRLSLITARYLGDSKTEQSRIYKTMIEGYRVRGNIVHGSKIKLKSAEKLVDELIIIYKRLVCKWVTDKSSGKTITFQDLLFD